MPKAKDECLRRFREETEANAYIKTNYFAYFDFQDNIELVGLQGDRFFIDAVSTCRQNGWIFGWEFKRSHLYKQEFVAALRQAIHYRQATVIDRRLPQIAGRPLSAVFVFPDWLGEHDEPGITYEKEAEGMRLLAAQFRVGTARVKTNGQLELCMGQNRVWDERNGWTRTACGILHGKRPIASQRRPS